MGTSASTFVEQPNSLTRSIRYREERVLKTCRFDLVDRAPQIAFAAQRPRVVHQRALNTLVGARQIELRDDRVVGAHMLSELIDNGICAINEFFHRLDLKRMALRYTGAFGNAITISGSSFGEASRLRDRSTFLDCRRAGPVP
jgi:hypothetical protein